MHADSVSAVWNSQSYSIALQYIYAYARVHPYAWRETTQSHNFVVRKLIAGNFHHLWHFRVVVVVFLSLFLFQHTIHSTLCSLMICMVLVQSIYIKFMDFYYYFERNRIDKRRDNVKKTSWKSTKCEEKKRVQVDGSEFDMSHKNSHTHVRTHAYTDHTAIFMRFVFVHNPSQFNDAYWFGTKSIYIHGHIAYNVHAVCDLWTVISKTWSVHEMVESETFIIGVQIWFERRHQSHFAFGEFCCLESLLLIENKIVKMSIPTCIKMTNCYMCTVMLS